MKDSLSRRVVKNGPLAIFLGFVVACSCCGLFALQLLPGFTRFHWGGWLWSTWSLFGGSLTTLVAFLWRPCFKTREQAALEEVTEVENGEQAQPGQLYVGRWVFIRERDIFQGKMATMPMMKQSHEWLEVHFHWLGLVNHPQNSHKCLWAAEASGLCLKILMPFQLHQIRFL